MTDEGLRNQRDVMQNPMGGHFNYSLFGPVTEDQEADIYRSGHPGHQLPPQSLSFSEYFCQCCYNFRPHVDLFIYSQLCLPYRMCATNHITAQKSDWNIIDSGRLSNGLYMLDPPTHVLHYFC